MMYKDLLQSFLDGKCSDKNFEAGLITFRSQVLSVGLVEEEIHLSVQIFLELEIGGDIQAQLLHCLVPREKIETATVNALLAWFFSNRDKVPESKTFLSWLSVMLSNNLIERKPVEKLFNQFLISFYFTDLIPPICCVLKHIVKPETVTPRAVFIASSFYEWSYNFPQKKNIAALLRLFHNCSPSLLPNPPPGRASILESIDDFHKAVSILAFRLGFLDTIPDNVLHKNITQLTTSNQFNRKSMQRKSAQLNQSFWENVCVVSSSRGFKHLGQMIKNNEIPSFHTVSSVIGSKTGQIFICWKQIFGNKPFPPEDEFTIFPYFEKYLETCQRMWGILPGLTPILSRYLIKWDGDEDEMIYKILPFIHFDSFTELYKNVLCHFIMIFITSILKTKLIIIGCLTRLITNKITEVPPVATIELIKFVCKMIKVALASDGLQSSALLFSSLEFYQQISCLEEWYALGTWTIPPPYLVFGALFSRNHLLISNVCELIIRHNTVMYPFYISMGLIDNFRDEEEIIKTYLKDLYFFLWKGQARSTILIASEKDAPSWLLHKDCDALLSVRYHYGITPLISLFLSQNELDATKHLNEKSLLMLFNKYAPGISALKSLYEGGLRES